MVKDGARQEQLEQACLELLANHPRGLSEHQLMLRLRSDEYALLPPLAPDDHLGLFQSHFLLFHALYRLRDRLYDEQRATLRISVLAIELDDYRAAQAALCEADPLRDYYLDLNNLAATGEGEVAALLAGFWRRMQQGQPERVAAALEVMGLERVENLAQLRQHYKRLVMRHHPDRGGEAARMQALNDAYAVLCAHIGHLQVQ